MISVRRFLYLSLLFSILYCSRLLANPNLFANFYVHFKQGAYVQAIESLERVRSSDQKVLATKEYLTALSLSRLQRFDEAIPHFEKAVRKKSDAEDLYYEFGQALYAANELERARIAFKKSYSADFKGPTSLYYMGFISQILEEFPLSITYFEKIIEDKEADSNSTQIAMFQKAESTLSLEKTKKVSSSKVEKEILPMFQDAYAYDKNSDTSDDIKQRIVDIQKEFGLDPTKYRNGRKISERKINGFVSQEIKYDNNITNSNDQATVDTTQKDSFVFNTRAKVGGELDFDRRFSFRPEMQVTLLQHGDRDTPEVYTNDSLEYNPSAFLGYEHIFNSNPATLSMEVSFRHKEQDVNRAKEKEFHSKSWSYTLGEKLKIFSFGETGFKFKYKTYRSYLASLDNNIKTFSIDQLLITKKGHIWLFLINYDDTDNYNDTNSSTASTLLRADWLIPEIFPSYTFHMAMSFTLLDTKEQSDVRGTEVTYSPMLKMQKKISDSVKASVDYTYSKNTSDSVDKEYSKHVTTLELRYSF